VSCVGLWRGLIARKTFGLAMCTLAGNSLNTHCRISFPNRTHCDDSWRARPLWDSNLPSSGQATEGMEIGGKFQRLLRQARQESTRNRTRQLSAIERFGVFPTEWLGGRDSNPFPASEASRDVPESCRAANDRAEGEGSWLGGRDSNPDNVVQSRKK
jgi:hypothetical protein